MIMKEQIDDLVERLLRKTYRSGSDNYEMPILHDKRNNETIAFRQVMSEWLQDHYQENSVQLEILKAKVMAYEEIIKKSTFAPFIEPPSVKVSK